MAESIVSDLAGKLLGYIGKQAFERIASYFGGTSELKKLEETMEMIQARLIDAEKRQEEEDGAAINVWLRRLKRVLYKLEDLFEEVEMADRDTNQYDDESRFADDEELEYLQLPPSLQKLRFHNWTAVRFPSWGMDTFPCLLPKLVSITIEDCKRCEYLPPFRQLPLLRFLSLSDLPALQYVENDQDVLSNTSDQVAVVANSIFYPSLERLELKELPELERWSRVDDTIIQNQQRIFPRLSYRNICDCPKLKSMPLAPKLIVDYNLSRTP